METDGMIVGRVSLMVLAQREAAETGIDIPILVGGSHERPIVLARWRVMARAYEQGYSSTQIGRFFNRDHTSVLHALRKMGVKRRWLPGGKLAPEMVEPGDNPSIISTRPRLSVVNSKTSETLGS